MPVCQTYCCLLLYSRYWRSNKARSDDANYCWRASWPWRHRFSNWRSWKGQFSRFRDLGQFTADNFAVNQTFGLIESFSHDYYCALCYAKKEEAQTGTVYSFFKMPWLARSRSCCAQWKKIIVSHVRGVKYDSPLNKLSSFHTMENWCNDAMHTVFQATISNVLDNLISALIKEHFSPLMKSWKNREYLKFTGCVKQPGDITFSPSKGVVQGVRKRKSVQKCTF